MFKFAINQVVHYFLNQSPREAIVASRRLIENNDSTIEALGTPGVTYATIDGVFEESQLFKTREELIASTLFWKRYE